MLKLYNLVFFSSVILLNGIYFISAVQIGFTMEKPPCYLYTSSVVYTIANPGCHQKSTLTNWPAIFTTVACFLLVSNLYTLPSTDIFQRTPDRRYDNSSNRGPRRHSPDRQRSSEGADSRSSTPRRKESGIFMLCRYIYLPHCFLFCPPIGTEFKRKDSDLNLWSVCSQPALALIGKSFYCLTCSVK